MQCIRRAKDISPKMMSCGGLYRQKPQRLCIMWKRKHTFFQAQIISHPIPYLRLVRGFSGYMPCFVFSNRGAVNYSEKHLHFLYKYCGLFRCNLANLSCAVIQKGKRLFPVNIYWQAIPVQSFHRVQS